MVIVNVIKRAPIRERRIPLKQGIEESTQLDDTPRLGRSSPDPERELFSHRYALVEQPGLAKPGAALHHDYATGPSPDLVQPPTARPRLGAGQHHPAVTASSRRYVSVRALLTTTS